MVFINHNKSLEINEEEEYFQIDIRCFETAAYTAGAADQPGER